MLDVTGFVDRLVRKYCLEDQEYATSAAFGMALGGSAGRLPMPLLLLLYEDLAGASSVAWASLWRFLGVTNLAALDAKKKAATSAAVAVARDATSQRRHADSICDTLTNCAEVHAALRRSHPCLAAQLLDSADSRPWTVPVVAGGAVTLEWWTVAVKGLCSPLAPLPAHRTRRLEELYVPTP